MTGAAEQLVPRHPEETPPVLLPYQQELLASSAAEVVLVEKSRRIGMSWAAASEAVTVSARSRAAHGMDTLYIGYNLDMAREFIDDCAFWSRHLHGFAAAAEEFAYDDKGHDIQAFRINFASGFTITALSSRPRSLRGRQGFVIVDEAAFHDDLRQLLKAAMALLMWGGRVWVISTHDGADNPFNELIEDVRAARKPYRLFRFTFDEAVRQGLYKRICLATTKAWSPEAEAAWCAKIRDYYGEDAEEELDAIPSKGEGVWLTRALIDSCMSPHNQVLYLNCEKGFELKPDHERHAFVEAWLEDHVQPFIDALNPRAYSFLGGDFGRTGDLTVIWPGQTGDGSHVLRVPFTIELRNTPFREQEQILNYVTDRLPRYMAGALDARGLGAALAEFYAQRYGDERVAQVMTTTEWYRENMPGFKARFEDETILIPLDDDTRADLRLVKLDKGVAKVPEGIRIRSARGGYRHGDAAIAGAMLHFASQMDVYDYGYESARPTRRPRVDEPASRDDDAGGGSRFGGIQGTW